MTKFISWLAIGLLVSNQAIAASTTANMLLSNPSVGDTDYPTSVSDSFNLIDAHDHTTGKGVQIPSGGIANGAITVNKPASSSADGSTIEVSSGAYRVKDGGITAAKLASGARGETIKNLGIAASVGSNAITISLKTSAGADPSGSDAVDIPFRSTAAATGTITVRSVTSALSLTISSGSTLGHTSGNSAYIYVYAVDNGGTVVLGASSAVFDNGSLQSSTAEGGAGAADSASVLYTSAALSSKPVRLIGRVSSNQATAGTWASSPPEISVGTFYSPATSWIGQTTTFNGSGTYTVPAGVTMLAVKGCGGGGGGGGGDHPDLGTTGGSGGGGGYNSAYVVTATQGASITVTVGGGGSGGQSGQNGVRSPSAGSSGSDTTLSGGGVSITFKGGGGGSATGSTGGSGYGSGHGGAPAANGENSVAYSGGSGSTGGGGGGGLGGVGAAGGVGNGSGSAASANTCGGGGGGGSGGNPSGTGGAGGSGFVVITTIN